ncbi:MAG: MFS transporter [Actinomycetota bacterium]
MERSNGSPADAAGQSGFVALTRRLNLLALVDEIGPLYALYTLWFADNGIGAAQVSTVFLLWAAVAIVLEIPSGAIADRVDRRRLVAVAFVVRAVGISLWLLFPSYPVVIAGAILWAIHSALASGAWEAMIHDQLTAIDRSDRYGTVMARVEQASDIGIAVGTVIAAAALGVGATILQLGWATVAIHALAIRLVLSLPPTDLGRDPASDSATGGPLAEWLATLRGGVAEALRVGAIGRLIVVLALVEGLFVFDEYVPLLGRDRGAPDSLVPILVLVVWVGLLAGSEVAARRPSLTPRTLGIIMLAGGALLLVGVSAEPVWTVGLIGLGYGALQLTWVVGGARLQERLSSDHRATVTSVRGFLGGIVNTAVFALIAARSVGDDPSGGLIIAAGLVVAVGLLTIGLVAPARAGS